MAEGRLRASELLGEQPIPPLRTDDAYYVPLMRRTIARGERASRLRAYAARYSAERDGYEGEGGLGGGESLP